MAKSLVVCNGRNCRVVYQNQASRNFSRRNMVGKQIIGLESGEWSIEAVRDRIWRGESFAITGGICLYGREMLIAWAYEPIRDARDRIVGFVSEGFERLNENQAIADLATWLECGSLTVEQSSSLFLLPSYRESLADSRRQLAQSLRRSLPPSPL